MNILGTVTDFHTFHPVIQENFSVFAVVSFHQELSYSKPFHDNLNYSSMANIEEIVKFYNPDNKTFETDFRNLRGFENFDFSFSFLLL